MGRRVVEDFFTDQDHDYAEPATKLGEENYNFRGFFEDYLDARKVLVYDQIKRSMHVMLLYIYQFIHTRIHIWWGLPINQFITAVGSCLHGKLQSVDS